MKQSGKRGEFKELNFKTTEEIKVPEKLIDQVIGQEKAKKIIRKAAIQRRHVLLIGKPGTGKSMLAKAMAEILPPTQLEDILVFPNEKDPYQPIIKTVPAGKGKRIIEEYRKKALLSLDTQFQRKQLIAFLIILFVAFFLQFFIRTETNPILEAANRISTTLFLLFFMLFISLAMYTPRLVPIQLQIKRREPKIIVDNSNKKTAPFVDATGAHEGALLGDVLHDPYQCFREGNIVFLVKDGKIIVKRIDEFVEEILNKNKDKILRKKEGNILIEAIHLKKPIYILGYKDGKVQPVRVLCVNRRIGKQKVLNINFRDIWISTTPDHKIFTKDFKKLEARDVDSDIFFRTFNEISILAEDDIIKTYGEKEIRKYNQYLKWLKFKIRSPNTGWKKASRILGIPASRVRWWENGMKPYSLKLIEKLRELNLLPLRLSDKRLKTIARILGALFGDGNIDKRMNCLSFTSSEREAIERFIEDLEYIFGEFNYEIRETGEYGRAYLFRTTDRRIIRFFVALGAPVGKKSNIKIKIPPWIFCRRDLIISFFDGWFSSDGSVPRYKRSENEHKLANTIEIPLINRHWETVEEIRKFAKYLRLLGINANVKVSRRENNFWIRLIISQSLENAIKLFKILDFKYSPKKKEKFERAILDFVGDIEEVRYRDVKQAALMLNKEISFYKLEDEVDITYNITTETGNLIVNGILVKNSGGLETPPHLRVVAGAIHKAHKGVLYVDEIATLKPEMQIELLTAMQEKRYPITGRSPRSAGALVQTTPAPCDFILVAAGTPETIRYLHPALRSRIQGYGYEVYMEDKMPDTPENRKKLAQFVAQEVVRDGNIPHFTKEAVIEIIKEAKRRAGAKGYLTLQLRDLAGLVRAAGDLARERGHKYVLPEDVIDAKEIAASVEEQYAKRYTEIAKRYMVIETKGSKIGKVNGLALISTSPTSTTEVGIIQPIEATVTPGSERGKIKVIATGKLGEIAKEAVQNVFAIIKKYRKEKEYDVHIQFLQTYGGVEGDSGSIAIATAVISALEGIPVKQDVAMTGSLSVLGEVLPVGGVNGKIKAAIEAGIKTVIIPYKNLDDITLSKKELEKVKIIPAKNLCDVLKIALVDCKKKKEVINKIKKVI